MYMRSGIKTSTKNDNVHGNLEYKNVRVNMGGLKSGRGIDWSDMVHVQHAKGTIYGQL